MKIIHYGLWFRHYDDLVLTNPQSLRCSLNLHGKQIGRGDEVVTCFFVWLETLTSTGFKLSDSAPGARIKSSLVWKFPTGYIPTESDFEELQ